MFITLIFHSYIVFPNLMYCDINFHFQCIIFSILQWTFHFLSPDIPLSSMLLSSVCLLTPITGTSESIYILVHEIVSRFCCVSACKNGRLSVAKILVAAGANVNELNYNNFTPLHCAVSSVSMSLYLFPRFVMRWGLVLCYYINAICSFYTFHHNSTSYCLV